MSNPGAASTSTTTFVGGGSPVVVGTATTDKVSFYGTTGITQPTAAAQAAVTDASGGTAAPTNGILTLTGSYNSTILANAIATLAAQGNAVRNALVSLGLIKGS